MEKSVLITGASTGIGKACALELDKKGYRVYAGVRKTSDGESLKAMASDKLRVVILDVTKEEQIKSAVEIINKECPEGLHVLINNAGVAVAGPLEFIPMEKFRNQIDINLIGVLAVTQKALPLLRKTNGRIINIGSVSGRVAFPMLGPYNASKFALEGLTDALRMELGIFGIKVIIIEPGPIETPIWEKSTENTRETFTNLPSTAKEYYSKMFAGLEKGVKQSRKMATPMSKLVNVIVGAIEKQNPKVRYLVGKGARLQVFLKSVLTSKAFDKLVTAGTSTSSGAQ